MGPYRESYESNTTDFSYELDEYPTLYNPIPIRILNFFECEMELCKWSSFKEVKHFQVADPK